MKFAELPLKQSTSMLNVPVLKFPGHLTKEAERGMELHIFSFLAKFCMCFQSVSDFHLEINSYHTKHVYQPHIKKPIHNSLLEIAEYAKIVALRTTF
jgi:hypothetical protein